MHAAAYEWVARQAPREVIEFGGLNVNGTVRDLFPNDRYTSVDIRPGDCVETVADAAEYRHPVLADVIVCCEVFEHVKDWRRIVENAARNLTFGGRFIVTCAGPGRAAHGVDGDAVGDDEWYENIRPSDLEYELRCWFSDVEVVVAGEDVYGVAVA